MFSEFFIYIVGGLALVVILFFVVYVLAYLVGRGFTSAKIGVIKNLFKPSLRRQKLKQKGDKENEQRKKG